MVYQDSESVGMLSPGTASTLTVREDPAGVTQSRPSRPLPCCWCSVKYTLRFPAFPEAASSASSVLVEPEVSRMLTSPSPSSPARASKTAGSSAARAQWFSMLMKSTLSHAGPGGRWLYRKMSSTSGTSGFSA